MIKINNYTLDNLDFSRIKAIEEKIIGKSPISNEEANYFLGYLVALTRKMIVGNFGANFENRCDLAQSIISSLLQQLGIEHHNVATQKAISDNVEGHSFTVVALILEGGLANFLVDPTYQQFFIKNDSDGGNKPVIIKGMICVSQSLESFIQPESVQLIENFIYWGFQRLNSDFAKIYGDSFLYTKTNIPVDYSFPNIPGEVYINSFLKGNEKLSYDSEKLKNMEFYPDLIGNNNSIFMQ